jgi:hypothetical protein
LTKDSTRKILEILGYLEAFPEPLAQILSGETEDLAFLKTFLFCVLSRHQYIRQLATKVANNLFATNKESLSTLQPSSRGTSAEMGEELWDRR